MTSRFSLSFPGRRGEDDPWFRIGAIDINTSKLVSLLCAISLFVWAASLEAIDHLVLWPQDVRSGQVWRLLTWPLANEPTIWVVITIAMFWIFGSELERMTGRVRFAWFVVSLAVIPGAIAVLLDLFPQAGIRPIEFVILLVFIAEYPQVRFFFGIPGWILGAVFLGIEVLQLIGNRNSDGLIFLVVTLLVGAIGGRSIGLLTEYPFIPRIPLSGGGEPKRVGSRGKARAIKGKSRDFDRRSGSTVVNGPWVGNTISDHAEMDRLLDKMNSVGLSEEERRRLTELGRRLRGG